MKHNLSSLKAGSHVHLIGICGTAMASLAGLLKDRGFSVTGSDSNPYPPMSTQIEKLGIQLKSGYAAKNLHPVPDFVIIGNVISASNEEAQEVQRLQLPFTSLPAAMGETIIGDRQSIVIAGTHGKTTTTSLVAWIAERIGVQPGFLIGGIPKNFSISFKNPTGNYFIIEGDEYDTAYFDKVPKFVHYRPRHVIFTSCEFDHADIYKDFAAVKSAFGRLMELIPEDGSLLYWAGDSNVVKVAESAKCKHSFSYGIGQGDFQAEICKAEIFQEEKIGQRDLSKFIVRKGSEILGEFSTSMSGDYNILNATAAIALGTVLGWNLEKIEEAVLSFGGVKRRQEILGEPGGVLIIEDFAHHPTAVRETLKGLRKRYQGRRLWAVFEPRSATSRRNFFQQDYVSAFLEADQICLAEAYDQSKIAEDQRFSSGRLARDLVSKGRHAITFPTASEIATSLVQNTQRGDVVVIMSNGGFDGIFKKILDGLAGRS